MPDELFFNFQGNHSEFLTLVSLDTDPPQVCHGAGTTLDLSHEQVWIIINTLLTF